ncbi:MAG: hypothetical protein WD602_06490 [Actinomycetota bacterium]
MALLGRSKKGSSGGTVTHAVDKRRLKTKHARAGKQRGKAAGRRRSAHLVKAPSRLFVGLVTAAGAVVAGAVARRHHERSRLPDAAALAAEAATSVRNAAKGTVIAWVRESDHPGVDLVSTAVDEAVKDALKAGVDVTAVAIGAVEGAIEVAHLVEGSTSQVTSAAAHAAVDAATAQGEIAGARVYDLLRPHLSRG